MRRLLFWVDVIADGPGRVYVGGRVCADLIRLEDCFTASVPTAALDQGEATPNGRPVSMVVRGILLYGKYLNQIDPGCTAELELELLGDGKPAAREALVGEAVSPPFEDYEILGTGQFHVKSV